MNAIEPKGVIIRYELLGIIAIMVIQTMGGIWWAASMTTDMANVKKELVNINAQILVASSDRYRAADASRDFSIIEKRLDRNEARIANLENRVKIVG